jgi:hypothetical protein
MIIGCGFFMSFSESESSFKSFLEFEINVIHLSVFSPYNDLLIEAAGLFEVGGKIILLPNLFEFSVGRSSLLFF